MSNQALLLEIQALRRELSELTARVVVLESASPTTVAPQVTVNYLGTPLPESSYHPEPTPPAAPSGETGSDSERAAAARSVGAFLRRSLAGDHRGESGRDRVQLQSRIYILCKDLAGNTYNPVKASMSEEEIDAAAPRPVQLRQCTVIEGETKTVDPAYPVGILELSTEAGADPVSVSLIAVGEFDNQVVVAVPFSVWHRTKLKRVLPQGSFTKPVVCTLTFVERSEGEEGAVVGPFKFWLGLLGSEFEDQVVFEAELDTTILDHPFTDQGILVLPRAKELVELFEQHFSFGTGVEQEPVPASPNVEDGISSLEKSLQEITAALKDLSPKKPLPKAQVAPPCPQPPGLSAPMGLDPEVVASARAAGIPEKQIQEMARVAAQGKTKLPDFPVQTKARKLNVLSESDEEEIPTFEAAEGGSGVPTGGGADVSVAVAKLTQIASHLVSQRQQSKSLEALLDGVGSGASTETGALTGNRKYAAALRMLRHTLKKKPQDISAVLERNMASDFEMATALPGSSPVPVSARAWLELRSRVQFYQTPVRLLWAIAGIYDAIKDQRVDEARSRCLLALAAGDQLSIDRGSWVIAQEILLEDPPNLTAFQQHTLPGDLEAPHSKLVDGRWMDLFIQKLNDWDSLAEKKRKLGSKKSPQAPNSEPSKAAEAKKGAKGKGKNRSQSGKNPAEEAEPSSTQ
eukprot:Skav231488  [mRNA]  locus=scaffold820:416816:419018:+ [translate_table: standard]